MLSTKKIILGLSGGIAAYKSINLIRLLIKSGAEVRVICTKNALNFVTKVTLESISKNKVYCDVFEENNDYATEHVALTDWGDICIVAPATANIIGKYAGGIADDALSTSLLAFNKPVFMAPAMNCKMWDNFSVQRNCSYLKANGVYFIEPTEGFLACGYEGKGRMAEPEDIVNFISNLLTQSACLYGYKALVTAGPTHEAIDPVRFIGNHASGKMGFAIAEALALKGADVTLVCGPVNINTSNHHIKRIDVVSSDDMFNACMDLFPSMNVCIMAAAVADFKPQTTASKKLKKGQNDMLSLEMVQTKDILRNLGNIKKPGQILVGFALETDNEIENARKKLLSKNLDFVVLNSLKDKGAGFGYDTNKISIISAGDVLNFDLKTKKEASEDIVNNFCKILLK
ncbi:MAG: bifunctional phosphopantothenoylcysteine decarboxylase/phosphopantothenate--cysteine ligase CoaBC [Bacteroidales bacterium]|nr:bifunctional phosphopantothenoylcysteine decarboxylase/phosphopantothenate--cysteine ligase CoaBC [Bacteroidales bacterium]